METTVRTICKAVSWQTSGLIVMSVLGYLMTGSLQTAGSFAVLTAAIGLVAFFIHERIWARVRWGIARAEDDAA